MVERPMEAIKTRLFKYHTVVVAKNKLLKHTCKIRWVALDVTDRCNQRCNKCLLADIKERHDDMTLQQFKLLLEQLPDSVSIISWAGMGEPLLNADTPEMIKLAHNEGYKTLLFTNGTIPHKEIERFIDQIVYNSDSFKEENVIDAGYVGAMYVLQSQLSDLYSFLDKPSKVKSIIASPARQLYPGAPLHRHQLFRPALTITEKEKLINYAKQKGKTLRFDDVLSWETCLTPWICVNISHNLQVTPCCIHQHPEFFKMGEITEKNSLLDIWHGESYRQLRKQMETACPNELCQKCGHV